MFWAASALFNAVLPASGRLAENTTRSSMSMRYRSTEVVQLRSGCHWAPIDRLRARSGLSGWAPRAIAAGLLTRSEEQTSELQSRFDLVCRLLLEKKKYED